VTGVAETRIQSLEMRLHVAAADTAIVGPRGGGHDVRVDAPIAWANCGLGARRSMGPLSFRRLRSLPRLVYAQDLDPRRRDKNLAEGVHPAAGLVARADAAVRNWSSWSSFVSSTSNCSATPPWPRVSGTRPRRPWHGGDVRRHRPGARISPALKATERLRQTTRAPRSLALRIRVPVVPRACSRTAEAAVAS
jgi:hypothetical protein